MHVPKHKRLLPEHPQFIQQTTVHQLSSIGSPMPTVLIADKMSPKAAEILRARGLEVIEDYQAHQDKAAFAALLKTVDGVAIRSTSKLTKQILEAAQGGKLKVIGRAGIGVDNVDIPTATAQGIVVMNTPFGNSITTAEHAIALMFALARELPEADRSTQAGKWEKNRFMGVELTGKTLGIIGCGNIGSIVADRALGLRMKVVAFDPFLTQERALDLGVEKLTLDELLQRADFISLHTPLTESTRNVLSRENLGKTKKGVRIINCARGGLIDEVALKELLESKHITGAALDVFAEEPATNSPLFGVPGFISTPHLGASTTEAQVNVALQIAEQMAEFLTSGGVSNALNMPSLTAEEAPKIKPYMRLAEQLGALAGQLTQSGIQAVSVEYEGAIAELNVKPVTAAVLAGLMRPFSDTVNMVNAPFLAKERNIAVAEVRHKREVDYHTLVRLTVKTNAGEKSVAGTLFANSAPRLVEMFGIKVEADLAGSMLFIINEDKPGFIGRLGTKLGEARVNIGTFHLGRRAAGGEAILLLSVDEPIGENLAQEITRIDGVKTVKPLNF
jgi:D-3-phosphoglycerate dehydrogenase / 2-oxoglutarate reductase